MADNLGEKIGGMYVEVQAETSKMRQAYEDIKTRAKNTSDSITETFHRVNLSLSGTSQVKSNFDGINLSVKELKLRLADLQNKLSTYAESIGVSESTLMRSTSKQAEGFRRIQAEIQSTKLKLAELKAEDSSSAGGNGFVSYFNKMLERIALRMAIMFALYKTFQFLKSSVETAENSQGIKQEFDKLNNPSALDKLRGAVRGVISDLQLMKLSIQASRFDVPTSTLTQGLELVRRVARDTGGDVNKLAETFVQSFGRKSPRALEQLGISTLDFQQKFKQTGSYIETVTQLIKEKLNETSDSALTAKEKFENLTNQTESFKNKIGEGLIPDLLALSGYLVSLEKIFEDNSTFAQGFGVIINSLAYFFLSLAAGVGSAITLIGAFKNVIVDLANKDYLAVGLDVEFAQIDLKKQREAYFKAMGEVGGSVSNPPNKSKSNPVSTYHPYKFSSNSKPVESTDVDLQMKTLKDNTMNAQLDNKGVSEARNEERKGLDNLLKQNLLLQDQIKVKQRLLELNHQDISSTKSGVSAQKKAVDDELRSLELKVELLDAQHQSSLQQLQDNLKIYQSLQSSKLPLEEQVKIQKLIVSTQDEILKHQNAINEANNEPRSVNQILSDQRDNPDKTSRKGYDKIRGEQIKAYQDMSKEQDKLDQQEQDTSEKRHIEVIVNETNFELDKFSEANAKKLGLEKEFEDMRKQIREAADKQLQQIEDAPYKSALDAAKTIGMTLVEMIGKGNTELQKFVGYFNQAMTIVKGIEEIEHAIEVVEAAITAEKVAQAAATSIATIASSGGALGILGGIMGMFGAHSGGSFVGTGSGVMKMASGGGFIVPSGYNNDSFPLMVESGEHVQVTPANQAGQQNNFNAAILNEIKQTKNSIRALNMNMSGGQNKLPPIHIFSSDPTVRVKYDIGIRNKMEAGGVKTSLIRGGGTT